MFIRLLVIIDALIICFNALSILKKKSVLVYECGEKKEKERFVWFAGFSLFTAPMFLYFAAEVKYVCWIFVVIYLLATKQYLDLFLAGIL